MDFAAKVALIILVSIVAYAGALAYVAAIRRQEAARRAAMEGFNMKKATRMLPMIGKVLKSAMKAITEIPKRIKLIGRSLKMIGTGAYRELVAVGSVPPVLVAETGKLVKCGVKFAVNITDCWLFYLLDFFIGTVYAIFVRLPLYILYFVLGVDLWPPIRSVYKVADEFDKMLHDMSGMHLIHYPDSITSKCYSCNLPTSKRVEKAFTDLGKPMAQIVKGFTSFGKVFK
jgi:hypothetical protein